MRQELLKRPELLSPAGDMECLKAAVQYGADAVYVGGKQFGMRAVSAKFDEDLLKEAVDYCHANQVKLYVTCNILPRNEDFSALPEFLKYCDEIAVDALIITDLGVMMEAKKYAPNVEIHISTQAGVVNFKTAEAFYDLGASRVVLARELSLTEISEMSSQIPKALDMEAFVHGAMCMSISGRCLISNYMTGRDANKGACAQPCRWEYELIEKKRPHDRYSLENDKEFTYIMNSRDMRLIEDLPKLIRAGVMSLKIEGRAKSAYYVASVTAAYRRAIDFFMQNPDEPLPEDILEETEKISHRAYSKGFYFGEEPGQNTDDDGYIRYYDVVAVCVGREGDYLKLKQRNRFFQSDMLNVLEPGSKSFSLLASPIFNADMEEIEVCPHAEMTVYLKTDKDIKPGAFFRVKNKKICT